MSVRDPECLGSWVYGGEYVRVVLAASFTAGFAAGICLYILHMYILIQNGGLSESSELSERF